MPAFSAPASMLANVDRNDPPCNQAKSAMATAKKATTALNIQPNIFKRRYTAPRSN